MVLVLPAVVSILRHRAKSSFVVKLTGSLLIRRDLEDILATVRLSPRNVFRLRSVVKEETRVVQSKLGIRDAKPASPALEERNSFFEASISGDDEKFSRLKSLSSS